ncbi:MAG: hypothetical protein J0I20_33815 [Chloroflexi bacterium]|nr:hypothetical protein [Chloroflexota bacterium]OJW05561.1 MAG: hypothetical protein BGO39_02790 [Chloroflexi bacterium 54-19]
MQDNNQQPGPDHYSVEHSYGVMNILSCAFLIQEDGNNIAVAYVNKAGQTIFLAEPNWPGSMQVVQEIFSKFLQELKRLQEESPGARNPGLN